MLQAVGTRGKSGFHPSESWEVKGQRRWWGMCVLALLSAVADRQ